VIDRLEQAAGRSVSRETLGKLEAFAALLVAENERQNLVSASTIDQLWERQVLYSAQLVLYEPKAGASWLDIGSGAGLPGIVIACLVDGPVTLVEPRRLRAEFLHKAVESLAIGGNVVAGKVESLDGKFDVITARAVAPLSKLFELSHHLSTRNSRWVLPKGRNAQSELVEAQRAWQGVFHVKQSLTDADSRIIVATGVKARRKA
jgi:16S rRNA (guanine527-N7)-methyltransferase